MLIIVIDVTYYLNKHHILKHFLHGKLELILAWIDIIRHFAKLNV